MKSSLERGSRITLPYHIIGKNKAYFIELPYWKDNLLRHNLDVMHIEKNVYVSVLGILLDLEGMNKDNLNVLDLKNMNIRSELHPREIVPRKSQLPPACFSLKKEEKKEIFRLLKTIKVPDGYAANISSCVDVAHMKINGLRSLDFHIIM